MIVNLGQPALYKLLDIFNKNWQEGTLTQIWREATMIPIHKKGKAKTEASIYRSISLTSCIVKVLERIINTIEIKMVHLIWKVVSLHRGSNYISSTRDWRRIPAQKANTHCMGRSTENIRYSLDWWSTSKTKVMQHRWDYVSVDQIISNNRRARLFIDNTKSKKILLRHGVPQGGVILPTFFSDSSTTLSINFHPQWSAQCMQTT